MRYFGKVENDYFPHCFMIGNYNALYEEDRKFLMRNLSLAFVGRMVMAYTAITATELKFTMRHLMSTHSHEEFFLRCVFE